MGSKQNNVMVGTNEDKSQITEGHFGNKLNGKVASEHKGIDKVTAENKMNEGVIAKNKVNDIVDFEHKGKDGLVGENDKIVNGVDVVNSVNTGDLSKENKKNHMRKKTKDKVRSIRITLLLSFSIPVILMAVFGFMAYNKSSKVIISNYEKNTSGTLNAIGQYLNLGLTSVSQKSVELMFNENINKYYNRVNTTESYEDITALYALGEEVSVISGTNDFIKAIHIFGEIGSSVSTSVSYPKEVYETFIKSEEGKRFEDKGIRYLWVGSHEALDSKLGVKKDQYSASIIRKISSNNGYIIMDISTEKIMTMLNQYELGDGSMLAFVTSDGRETLVNNDNTESVFVDKDYFTESLNSNLITGNSYEHYKGNDYLYLYSKIGDTGAMVCALVPKGTIIKQALEIRDMIVAFIVFACILAVVIGLFISSGIGNAIGKLSNLIAMASKGDLTVKFATKRKDEFSYLSRGLNEMIAGIRNLIGEASQVGLKVSNSASILSNTSDDILAATKDISTTIDEIEKGVVQQAADTERCLSEMSNLSDKINQVYSSTYEIEKIAGNTEGIVGEGIVIIDELNQKTKATSGITNVVINEIEALEVQTRSIGNFVSIINDIASQTNLLSLNASIEAARAGDAGRGFAVVADEIRKLADQSVKAANQIQDIVSEIQSKTKGTVTSAKQAEGIVASQEESLGKTIRVFEDINKHVGDLTSNLDIISIGVKAIENAKEDTMEAIRSISAISQQSAASSEEVSATANNQIGSVENLSKSAAELAGDAKKLEEAIKLFKIIN